MINVVFLGGEDVSARIDISKKLMSLVCDIEIIGSEKKEIFKKNNIKYTKFNLNREFNIFDDIKSIFYIRKFLKQKKNETIVHAFDTKLTIFLPLAAVGLKNIKVIRTINGMGRLFTERSFKNRFLITFYKYIQKFVENKVDFTVFQNTDNYNYFIKNKLSNVSRSQVIKSSGIDILEFSSPVDKLKKDSLFLKYINNKNLPTFILISRLIKQKGVSNFLEAAKLCHLDGFKFNFLLVGQIDSNSDAVSSEEIDSYKKYVTYLGRQTNINELLSISDVFVFPSYYSEGVPRVLLEASAMSTALLTTNMPGCNDVLLDGINGLMVKVNNSKDLCYKMISIVNNSDALKKMKENSFNHVRNFSLEKVTSEYLKIYKLVLN